MANEEERKNKKGTLGLVPSAFLFYTEKKKGGIFMYILLALDHANGINSFEQFSSIVVPILLFLIIWLFLYVLPSTIIANAIKKIGNISPESSKKNYVSNEKELYFVLDNGIRVYKDMYNEKQDLYESVYGYYIPIYNYNEEVVAFMYESKSK